MDGKHLFSFHACLRYLCVCLVFAWLLFLECAGMRLLYREMVLPVITVHSSDTAAGHSGAAIRAAFSAKVRDYR